MTWNEPRITIGDVPLLEHRFSWSLQAGTLPFTTTFIVPRGTLNDQLKAVQNPTIVRLEVFGGTSFSGMGNRTLVFENIYLLQAQEVDDFNVMWQVSDTRFSWRGQKMYCAYNKTRVKNEIGISVTSPTLDPSSLRAAIDVFAIGRYLPWSVKSDGHPYSMLEIVEQQMTILGIGYDAAIEDHSYIVENVEIEGMDVYSGLANLLARSRLNLGILPNGRVYVYSLDYFDTSSIEILRQNQRFEKTGPGVLYVSELSRVRPRRVTVKFEKKVETVIVASSSNDVPESSPLPVPYNSEIPYFQEIDIFYPRVIGCENVIRVPVPYLNFRVGEYVPMWRFLSAINISDYDVRRLWFSNRLEFHIAFLLTQQSNGIYILSNFNLAMQLAHAIKAHYRQVYQLDPYWMAQIKNWEARRVTVIDNYSRFSPPSPLYADYCIIPRVRTPSVAKNFAPWADLAYNWIVNLEDPLRERPTLGTIVVENLPLGIFRVSYPSDLTQTVESVVPSAVDNLPKISPSASQKLWVQANLKEVHTMEAIIAIIWQAQEFNKDEQSRKYYYDFPGKYYQVEWEYEGVSGMPAKGPAIEYLSRLEYARIPLKGRVSAEEFYTPKTPVNEKILTALAASEAAKIMNQYKDRVIGHVKVAGIADIKLNGNIKAITYQFGEGGLQTIVDMREIPPDPTLEQTLPQEAINYLFRHVSRADTMNEKI